MILDVKHNSIYKELFVKDGGASIESGLLDESEATEIAMELISAGAELLPPKYDETPGMLYAIIESLRS